MMSVGWQFLWLAPPGGARHNPGLKVLKLTRSNFISVRPWNSTYHMNWIMARPSARA